MRSLHPSPDVIIRHQFEMEKEQKEPLVAQLEAADFLSLKEKIFYTLPNFSRSFAQSIFSVWSFRYYTDAVELSLNRMNAGFVIAEWVYLLALPISAYFADNFHSKYDRYQCIH